MGTNFSIFYYQAWVLIYWSKHCFSTLHCYNGAWFGIWRVKIQCQLVNSSHGCGVDGMSLRVIRCYFAGQVVCIISKDPSTSMFGVRQSKIAGLIDPEVSGTMTIWKIVNYFAQWPKVRSQKIWLFYNWYMFNFLIIGPEAVLLLNSHTLCSCWFGCGVCWKVIGDIFCHLITLCATILLLTLM